MREKSLRSKLFLFVMGLMICSSILSVGMLWLSLESSKTVLLQRTDTALRAEIRNNITAKAGQYSEIVSAFINEAYRIPASLAGMVKTGIERPELAVTRETLQTDLQNILRENEQVSSIYAQFEPNAYDNKDAQWVTGDTHSVATKGTLEIYFTRNSTNGGELEQQTIDTATSIMRNILTNSMNLVSAKPSGIFADGIPNMHASWSPTLTKLRLVIPNY
mgnify:CR=1 FL=1